VKYVYTLLLVLMLPVSLAMAQNKAPQSATDVDIYHVHFNKAVPGQAAALAETLKIQDAKAPMPGHVIVLRHQEGDDWGYCVIEHLGTKATVEANATPPNPAARNLSAWHSDTFAIGPPWADFARAMGISADTKAKSANSIYAVATWRAVPGHRDELLNALKQRDPSAKVQINTVVMQHIEGGPWNFLAIDHYNSWQDFATDEAANMPKTGTGKDGWSQVRQFGAYHIDTLADRISPK
jgi:hypothetical protein